MKISTLNYRKFLVLSGLFFAFAGKPKAQTSDSVITRTSPDTTMSLMNMDAVYDRPFLEIKKNAGCNRWLP